MNQWCSFVRNRIFTCLGGSLAAIFVCSLHALVMCLVGKMQDAKIGETTIEHIKMAMGGEKNRNGDSRTDCDVAKYRRH